MKKKGSWPKAVVLLALFLIFLFVSQPVNKSSSKDFISSQDRLVKIEEPVVEVAGQFNLLDFYKENQELDWVVDQIIDMLSDEEKISQMVITYFTANGKDSEAVIGLIINKTAGGVIFFERSNQEIARLTRTFNDAAKEASSVLLPVFAIDGEPTFMSNRFGSVLSLPVAGKITTVEKSSKVAGTIALLLRDMGIHINYAPVCDLSLNRDIIGYRSFGSDIEQVSVLAQAFVETTQANGIVATAKHFPGHGSVEGDTHKELVFIEGEPLEVPVFRHVIQAGVISIMVGHVGIRNHEKYDTEGKPSTISKNIVADLLKNELGFKGIVVTDAMKMNAVESFSMSCYEAARAGCDMILMPRDELGFIRKVHREIQEDEDFRDQIMQSVKKIVRLKVCLGLVNGEIEGVKGI